MRRRRRWSAPWSCWTAGTAFEEADAIRDEILPGMRELRAVCDEAESLTAAEAWPFPTYGELLFSVR